jgi:ligand-binding sensor domain-containing protein
MNTIFVFARAMCLFLIAVLFSLTLPAQNPLWVNVSTTENIYCMAEEGNYLWIGTDGGLVKWDKTLNVPTFFTKEAKGGLMTSIKAIAIDKNKVKWLATDNMGLVIFDGTNVVFKNSFTDPTWKYNQITSICIDKNNNKWMASGYAIFKLDSAMRVTTYIGGAPAPITSLVVDSAGNKWVGTTQGLYKFDGTSYTNINSGDILLSPAENITCLGLGKRGMLYIGSSINVNGSGPEGGFITLQDTVFKKYTGVSDEVTSMYVDSSGVATFGAMDQIGTFDGSNVTINYTQDRPSTILKDSKGNIWCGSASYNLKKWQYPVSQLFDIRNAPIHANEIGTIEIENGTDAWITNSSGGVTSGGLNTLKNGAWEIYDNLNTNALSYQITALHIDSKGDKWIGGADGEVTRFNGAAFVNYGAIVLDYGPSSIQNIKEDPSGNIWLTAQIMAKYDGSSWKVFTSSTDLPTGFPIINFDIDKQGHLWAGTSRGLYEYDGASWYPYGNYLKEYSIIHIDKSGNKWLSTGNGGLEKFDGTNFTVYTTDNSALPNDDVTAITTDSSGLVWAGCSGGYLIRFDGSNWNVIGPDQSGVPSANITSIRVDAKGNKWIGTDHGLVIYNENGVGLQFPSSPYLSVSSPIINPRIADTLSGCSTYVVKTRDNILENATLWFSSDSSATWQWVGNFSTGTSSYNWSVPPISSNRCKLRLITAISNDTVYSGLFSIRYAGNTIVINSPDGQETWHPGDAETITWSANAAITRVSIYYSTDYGATWTNIAYVANTGSYNWVVPNISGQGIMIQIADFNSNCVAGFKSFNVSVVTAVQDFSNQNTPVLIYPNPSSGTVYLSTDRITDFLIVDAQGNEVPFQRSDDGTNTKITFSGQVKGLFCIIGKGDQPWRSKFVIE